jgi:hypothetical protein
MAEMKRMVGKTKNSTDGSNTKPFNVKLMTPRELVGGKEPKKPMPKKPAIKRSDVKPAPLPKKTTTPKTTTKAPAKSKMTPQDAAMLKILKKKYGNDVYKG